MSVRLNCSPSVSIPNPFLPLFGHFSENPLEPGSGLDILSDLVPMFKNKRAGPKTLLHSLTTGDRKLIGEERVRRRGN